MEGTNFFGQKISEDELYNTIINSPHFFVKAWMSPDSEIFLVDNHLSFIRNQMMEDVKLNKNIEKRKKLQIELYGDSYLYGYKNGWIRFNISGTQFGVDGCKDKISSKLGYLRSLAKQTDRELSIGTSEC